MKRAILLLSLAGILSGGRVPGQEGTQAPGSPLPSGEVQGQRDLPKVPPSARVPLEAADFTIPIHSAEPDPVGGEYGIWASGPDYKVSFHDGFAFYPLLGRSYPENLPLLWKTESVTAGGRSLVPPGTAPETRFTDWRFEYRYPGITEAYDVRKSGVEQTFVLASPPPLPGDLVVTGRITTRLEADPAHEKQGPLVFKDRKGTALVRYGSAWAVDAAGRKTEVLTSFDGARIRLTLRGSWLARAAFPVTIDPIVARERLSYWIGAKYGGPRFPDIGRDDLKNQVLVTYARYFSASDLDGYARLCNDYFKVSYPVFWDITSKWSTSRLTVAFVGGARRWVVAFERDFLSPKASAIRVHLHDSGDPNTSLSYIYLPYRGGYTYRYPDVGGTFSHSTGNNALIVYQVDKTTTQANTPYSDVLGVLLDAKTGKAGAPFVLGRNPSGALLDQEHPSVSQVSDGANGSWIVAWQFYENNVVKDDWEVMAARITHTGYKAGWTLLAQPRLNVIHKFFPKVEGRKGHYLVAYLTSPKQARFHGWWGTQLWTQPCDWAENSSAPGRRGTDRTIWKGYCVHSGLAFDTNTTSHWAVAFKTAQPSNTADEMVARVGYTGATVETAVMGSKVPGATLPAVTFNDDWSQFDLVYGTSANKNSVYACRFAYPAGAVNKFYGKGCGGRIYATAPFTGSRKFTVMFYPSAPRKTVAILLVGVRGTSIPLDGIGMKGCSLYVDPAGMTAVSTLTGLPGRANVSFPLPDYPPVSGDVYFQWFFVEHGANSAGLLATNAIVSHIR